MFIYVSFKLLSLWTYLYCIYLYIYIQYIYTNCNIYMSLCLSASLFLTPSLSLSLFLCLSLSLCVGYTNIDLCLYYIFILIQYMILYHSTYIHLFSVNVCRNISSHFYLFLALSWNRSIDLSSVYIIMYNSLSASLQLLVAASIRVWKV